MSAEPPSLPISRLARPWVFCLAVLALFFGIDRLTGFVMERLVEKSQHRFSRVYAGVAEPAIVVIGHSRGVQAVSPAGVREATGTPVFNLSANGMSTRIGEALFYDYCDRGAKPAGLIIEVSSICSDDSLIRDLKIFAGESERLRAILRERSPALAAASEIFHAFRYNGGLTPRLLYHLRGDDQGLTNVFEATPEFLNEKPIPRRDWQVQEENPEAIRRLLAYAAERDIPVRLLLAPFWKPAVEGTGIREDILESVARVTDVKVWDFSESLAESKFFADHVHLNANGTEALHREMTERGFFRGLGRDEKR